MADTIVLPSVLTQADLDALVKARGGLKSQFAQEQSLQDKAARKSKVVTFVFNDGTSFTASWSGEAGGWAVDDWGTLGKQIQTESKSKTDPGLMEVSPNASLYDPTTGTWRGQAPPPQTQPAAPQTPEAVKALQDYEATVSYLEKEIASGRMTSAQANQIVKRQQEQIQATLHGTPFQREQFEYGKQQDQIAQQMQERQLQQNALNSERGYQTDRAQMGTSLTNSRVGAATSMGQSLLNTAMEGYGKILPGTGAPTNFNPLAMALSFAQQAQGPEAQAFAQAVLQAAMNPIQGQAPDQYMSPMGPAGPEQVGDSGIDDAEFDAVESRFQGAEAEAERRRAQSESQRYSAGALRPPGF